LTCLLFAFQCCDYVEYTRWCGAVLSFLKALPGELARLAMATLGVALLNLLLFYAGWYAWALYTHTHTGTHFARLHPEAYQRISDIVAMTPYWQPSLSLAVAAVAGTFVIGTAIQLPGLRKWVFDPLPLPLKGLWAVGLSLLLAFPFAGYDARLASWEAYACLLLPGMLCLLLPAMRSVSRLVPDLSMLLSGMVEKRRRG